MSEQSVTYVDLRFHTPAEEKRKQRPRHTRVIETSEQEITCTDLKFLTPSKQQRQQRLTSAESKESPSPSSPWLITVILGLFCLALLVTAGVLGVMFLQASHQVRRQNEELIQKQAILKNFTQLQETLKNCMQQRDDFQANNTELSNVLNKKVDKCSSCPEGWIQHRGKCYHFTNERSSRQKSKEYCSFHGSSLLRIGNKEELDFINGLACFHWIGLFRTGAATSWMWEDGTAHSPDLFQVKKQEPGESCVLLSAGEATSYTCSEQYRCICEKRAA
ncbi:C-type lectin domain family 9 member A-like [Dermochelys coriacea]|uniref:C-type lectin domain family 9 member A-like n=1 Tax=Dermochelys coriacea TaxID=27794 RepID=UPI0018E80FC8|nr:C-type lectin domain family 9 member A-like [Dermochelys coriacea]XP_043369657.1 C-type lectin domain family 9 member A-like [Dermochelys coriacea]